MGKFNEIQEQTTQSWGANSFTTTIKDNTVEFDSAKDKFTFKDPVEVPSINVGGTESVPFTSDDRAKLDSLQTPMQIKGRVDSVSDLPTEDVTVGDTYLVGLSGSETFDEYVCTGFGGSPEEPVWESVGSTQVQSDWNQTTTTALDYIKNKPAIVRGDDNTGAGTCVIMLGNTASDGSSSSLVIGSDNTAQYGATYDLISGTGNSVQYGASNNLVGGSSNNIAGGASQSIVCGAGNRLDNSSNFGILSGQGNRLDNSSVCDIVSGSANNANAGTNGSLVIGNNNYTNATGHSIVYGQNNSTIWGCLACTVAGMYNVGSGQSNFLNGQGNQSFSSAQSSIVNGMGESVTLTRTAAKTYTASGDYRKYIGARIYFGVLNGNPAWAVISNATYASSTTTFTTDADYTPESGSTFTVYFGNQVYGSNSIVSGEKNVAISYGKNNIVSGQNNSLLDYTSGNDTTLVLNSAIVAASNAVLQGSQNSAIIASDGGSMPAVHSSVIMASSSTDTISSSNFEGHNAIIASNGVSHINSGNGNVIIASVNSSISGNTTEKNLVTGNTNTINANNTTCNIVGGSYNSITGGTYGYGTYYNVISGFGNNISGSYYNTIGGNSNSIDNVGKSVISGDSNTVAGNQYAAVFGNGNTVRTDGSIVGGYNNTCIDGGAYGIIGGSSNTIAQGGGNSIVTGYNNTVNGTKCAILGSSGSTIPGSCVETVILGSSSKTATASNTVYMTNSDISGIITLGSLQIKDDSGVLKVSDDGGTTWKTVTLS